MNKSKLNENHDKAEKLVKRLATMFGIRNYYRNNSKCVAALTQYELDQTNKNAVPLYLINLAIEAVFREEDEHEKMKMIESLSRIKIKEFINSVAMAMQDLSDFGKDDIDEVTIKEFSSIFDFIYEYYHFNPVIDNRQQKTMKVQ